MALHRTRAGTLKIDVFFCDPHGPWRRGSHERANGVVLTHRPCKILDFNPWQKEETMMQLEARAICYFSEHDEAAFFEWLDKMPAIRGYQGKGDTLYIEVDPDAVDRKALRELLALFFRYGVDLKQLAVFDRPEFTTWFRDERAYWFDKVFGAPA